MVTPSSSTQPSGCGKGCLWLILAVVVLSVIGSCTTSSGSDGMSVRGYFACRDQGSIYERAECELRHVDRGY